MNYTIESSVLAIDPGVKYLGWALGRNLTIVACGYLGAVEDAACLKGLADVCIIEKPQQYSASKARRKDVTNLTVSAGEIKAYVSAPVTLMWEPREWKGQVPKAVHQQFHILPALQPCELEILPVKKTERGHVIDAVGIALRFMRRI